MRVLTWVFAAVLAGVNLHALLALGAALAGRPAGEPRQRAWAIRCALSAVGMFAFSGVLCAVSISSAFSVGEVEPSERARHLAMGISDAMNFLAFGGLGLALPLLAALVLIRHARQSLRRQ